MGEKRLRTGRRQTQGGPMSDHVRELDEKIDAYIEEVWEDVVGDIRTLVRIPDPR